jgi:hypothetical protein
MCWRVVTVTGVIEGTYRTTESPEVDTRAVPLDLAAIAILGADAVLDIVCAVTVGVGARVAAWHPLGLFAAVS